MAMTSSPLEASNVEATAVGAAAATTAAIPIPRRSAADRRMRRLLRLSLDAPPGTAAGARTAFQTSLLVATVRCLLMYLVFPFVLPALGITRGVGPAIGLVVNLAAMVCIVLSMRRFFGADHRRRWWYAALGSAVLVLLTVLAAVDVADLLS